MSALQGCVDECRRCAVLFRLGRDVEAALDMVEVFEGVQHLLVPAAADAKQAWTHLLTQMLDCQERQDWLGLADFMEYELIHLLESSSA
ncbi:hypothetical protein [Pseudomonas sp. KCJK9016]|uniref:hypothetical protein n=1 Tax=Pseudomonas sp. KCJK9016 TaxID=3344556 RepID=UPI0039061EF4